MKPAIQHFHELSESVHKNIKDSSLVATLEHHLLGISLADIDVQVYCRLMMSIYDLSNHHVFISAPSHNTRISIHAMSIRLKILSMKMVGCLVKIVAGQTYNNRLDRELQVQALEIMVLSIRICLDQEDDYIGDVMQCWKYCQMLYQNATTNGLAEDVHVLYVLDKMDMLRLVVGESFFSIGDLQQCIQLSLSLFRSKTLPPQYVQSARSYVENIVTEIALKLLRNGNTEFLTTLQPYLPEKFKNMLDRVNSRQKQGNTDVDGMGEVYQLYCQITADGMEGVSMEYLEKFIARDNVFNGQQVFEAILLLDEPCLLEIWFNEANRRTTKPKNYLHSYECFISLVVSHLKSHTSSNLNNLVKLCKQVILSLIREPKDTKVEIGILCTYIIKLCIMLVVEMYHYATCAEMLQNLHLLSTKHSLPEISKLNCTLHLYYSLVNNCKNLQIYSRFVKLNSGSFGGSDKDKNKQPLKLLKVSAQMQLGITQINQEFIRLVKNKPEFALLFLEPKDKILLVLELSYEDFICIQDLFELYSVLVEENCWDDANLQRIAYHMENILLTFEFSKLKISQDSALRLRNCLGRLVEKENPIFSMLFLYLTCFCREFDRIRSEQYGIVLNKFSKMLKIIDLISMSKEIVCILKIIICKSSQNFKKQSLMGKCTPQPGQIIFLKILCRKIEEWLSNQTSITAQEDRNSQQFVKYCLFQIFCLHNRQDQLQQIIDEQTNPHLQQLYASSQFIPRNLKLILLRKLFKSNLLYQDSLITLNDLKELILLSETPQQCFIYVTSSIKMFGDKGKKFIGLLAQENPKVGEVCLQILSDE